MDDPADIARSDGNLAQIVGKGIPIYFTVASLSQSSKPKAGRILAYASANGVVYTVDNKSGASTYTMAHELGHVTGYVGNAKGDLAHNKDPKNLMYYASNNAATGSDVDKCWCENIRSAMSKR